MEFAETAMRSSQTKLKVWGTSRAVRIPKRICDILGIATGSVLIMEEGCDERGPYLTLRPAEQEHRSYSDAPIQHMDELFEDYSGPYIPHEPDWGGDVGSEVVA